VRPERARSSRRAPPCGRLVRALAGDVRVRGFAQPVPQRGVVPQRIERGDEAVAVGVQQPGLAVAHAVQALATQTTPRDAHSSNLPSGRPIANARSAIDAKPTSSPSRKRRSSSKPAGECQSVRSPVAANASRIAGGAISRIAGPSPGARPRARHQSTSSVASSRASSRWPSEPAQPSTGARPGSSRGASGGTASSWFGSTTAVGFSAP
jgi:hypothetical protein